MLKPRKPLYGIDEVGRDTVYGITQTLGYATSFGITDKSAAGSGPPPTGSTYRRPGGVDTYRRPGGVDIYLRP